jgi:hypothetical protein
MTTDVVPADVGNRVMTYADFPIFHEWLCPNVGCRSMAQVPQTFFGPRLHCPDYSLKTPRPKFFFFAAEKSVGTINDVSVAVLLYCLAHSVARYSDCHIPTHRRLMITHCQVRHKDGRVTLLVRKVATRDS